jgi:hypothetical protein
MDRLLWANCWVVIEDEEEDGTPLPPPSVPVPQTNYF